ncbi:MAG TPA: ATP-dependent helicase [Candidatus Acidoferrales bacterium]|nr:ATP-dependent helicase [Candidatus Acidoferrales bacterium]
MAIVLTDEQKAVVTSFGAPLRVLAGPGTGKTLCLVERVRFLITQKKISHEHIFVVTFTKRAAGELRNRLLKSGIKKEKLPYVSTLHGLAMRILKKHQSKAGLPANFQPITNVFARILLKDTVQALSAAGIQLSQDEVREFNHAHHQNKARAGIPSHISSNLKKKKALTSFSKIFHEQLRFYDALEWSDVIESAIALIECDKGVREEVHDQIRYLLVDEYQDLSPLEQDLIEQLIDEKSGLCVVGDDDQSIYESFRFAAPRGIINFEKNHRGTVSKFITLCRRCPPEIIKAALRLIQNNRERQDKNLKAFDKDRKGIIVPLSHRSKKGEIAWLVSKMKELLEKKKFQPRDIMILFTDGDIAKDYIIELEKEKIPLDIQLKVSHIFESEEFVGFFSMLKLLSNLNDNLNARQAMDFWRGIGPETVRHLRSLVTTSKGSLWTAVNKVADHQDAFKEIRQRKVVLAFREFILELQKIDKPVQIIKRIKKQFPAAVDDHGVEKLIEHVKGFSRAEEILNLKEIIEDFEQKIDSGELESNEETNKTRIMTMHSAKGCESPIVIMPALEDDIIPGNAQNVEEKRRLFYVSVTRTKYALFLSWASQRSGQEIHKVEGRKLIGKIKSRFLVEMGNK